MAIELISKIKPKNGGTFPMVDAEDVLMPDGSRLSNTTMGEKGEKGDKGDKGDPGEQGIQGEKGEQGETGIAGYTPIRGVDYFNEEDIAAIKGYIDGMFVPLTQEEYDALVTAGTVNDSKYYMIVGDSE